MISVPGNLLLFISLHHYLLAVLIQSKQQQELLNSAFYFSAGYGTAMDILGRVTLHGGEIQAILAIKW